MGTSDPAELGPCVCPLALARHSSGKELSLGAAMCMASVLCLMLLFMGHHSGAEYQITDVQHRSKRVVNAMPSSHPD
jgi:hypothetical protein